MVAMGGSYCSPHITTKSLEKQGNFSNYEDQRPLDLTLFVVLYRKMGFNYYSALASHGYPLPECDPNPLRHQMLLGRIIYLEIDLFILKVFR